MFVILQKYDFSSKSQRLWCASRWCYRCLWYCKSTIFQANHNLLFVLSFTFLDVCDTAKVRFFKQITTAVCAYIPYRTMFVILQKYDFSSKSQRRRPWPCSNTRCLWYCKSTIFQANHNGAHILAIPSGMFVILQKYDFSSKSQPFHSFGFKLTRCLWYCKSTIFQANHNLNWWRISLRTMFVILQKYDFSSKSQHERQRRTAVCRCLWYCKSTIFQANHNYLTEYNLLDMMFVILQKYDFSSKSQLSTVGLFKMDKMFVILQKYDFSSKSQQIA